MAIEIPKTAGLEEAIKQQSEVVISELEKLHNLVPEKSGVVPFGYVCALTFPKDLSDPNERRLFIAGYGTEEEHFQIFNQLLKLHPNFRLPIQTALLQFLSDQMIKHEQQKQEEGNEPIAYG